MSVPQKSWQEQLQRQTHNKTKSFETNTIIISSCRRKDERKSSIKESKDTKVCQMLFVIILLSRQLFRYRSWRMWMWSKTREKLKPRDQAWSLRRGLVLMDLLCEDSEKTIKAQVLCSAHFSCLFRCFFNQASVFRWNIKQWDRKQAVYILPWIHSYLKYFHFYDRSSCSYWPSKYVHRPPEVGDG